MLVLRHFVFLFFFLFIHSTYAEFGRPDVRVHRGPTDITQLPSNHNLMGITEHYQVGETYTFEVYLDETTQHDYLINHCHMNNEQIIGPDGCVDCGNCIVRSIETEAYNKPGAVKRTLVEFVAQTTTIAFTCSIEKYVCSGCAERSCERRNIHPWDRYQTAGAMTINYPPAGYQMPPMGMGWPWWVWLLILLLLLLLLCCLLALCFAAFMKRRKEKKAAAAVVVVDGKDCAVGTDRVSVTCVGTDTQDMVKVQPALILGAEELHHHHQQHHNQYRSGAEFDQGSVMAGGSYSVRESHIHEGYTRTIPRDSYSTNDRYASRDRFERNSQDKYTDRSSYRNFAYERDMGRVEPMDGYDEVETRERTYCLSDDDQEIVEKNIKRTHTTRYVTESREYEHDHDNEERMRGDEYHHATYTHSLPV